MREIDRDKVIRILLTITTLLLAIGVIINSILMIIYIVPSNIGGVINAWLIFALSFINTFVAVKNKTAQKWIKILMLIICIIVFIIALIASILVIVGY